MTAAGGRIVPGGTGLPDFAGLLLPAVPGAVLVLLSPLGPLPGGALLAAAIALAAFLALPRLSLGPALPLLPLVVALGALAATARLDPLTEGLAGLAGLTVVLAVGRAARGPELRGAVTRGLLVPGLGLGIALATAFIFPPSERTVGVAALLLLGTVAALAFLLPRPATAPGEGA